MTTNRPPRPTFRLLLQAEPQADGYDPAGTTRLKRALKRLLRGFGLKCLRVEPHQEQVPKEGSKYTGRTRGRFPPKP